MGQIVASPFHTYNQSNPALAGSIDSAFLPMANGWHWLENRWAYPDSRDIEHILGPRHLVYQLTVLGTQHVQLSRAVTGCHGRFPEDISNVIIFQ